MSHNNLAVHERNKYVNSDSSSNCFSKIDEIDFLIKRISKIKLKEEVSDNYLNCEQLETNKMTQVDLVNSLVNRLKIPDSIKDLPRYEGNRHTLYDFIDNVDEIINQCYDIIGDNQIPKSFIRAIRNKISGEADEILTMYGTPLSWVTIKENLISHYADKRNETSLIRDLHLIYQSNDTIEKYFSRVIDIQTTILTHVRLTTKEENVIEAKEKLYKEMCLSTFLAGLKEPMGSMIRAWQPKTINDAFSLCMKEQNMHYMKTKVHAFEKPQLPPRTIHYQPLHIPSRQYQNIVQPRLQIPQASGRPTNQYYNHKPFPNQNLQYRNNFQQPSPNRYNPPQILPPKPQYRKIEPMDTTSNQNKFTQPTRFSNIDLGYNKPYPFQQNRTPRFQSQELFNIEEATQIDSRLNHPHELADDENYFPNLDYVVEEPQVEPQEHEISYSEIDDTVFREQASETPSDM